MKSFFEEIKEALEAIIAFQNGERDDFTVDVVDRIENKYSYLDYLHDFGVVRICKCVQCSSAKSRLATNTKRILSKKFNTHRRRFKPAILNHTYA